MATVDETHALGAEVIRLREGIKWYWRLTGQLQDELRVTRAIGDFWAAEADRNPHFHELPTVWDYWQGSTSWSKRVSMDERIPAIVSWHARRDR